MSHRISLSSVANATCAKTGGLNNSESSPSPTNQQHMPGVGLVGMIPHTTAETPAPAVAIASGLQASAQSSHISVAENHAVAADSTQAPSRWPIKPYYEHDGIVIFNCDCREILPTLPKVDLVLTDPPYGVNLGNHGGAKDGRNDHVLVKGAYRSYDDTFENLCMIVVPAIRTALSISTRGIVFCAGQHIGEYPKPNVAGGIYFPAAQGRNQWGFSSLAHALFYGPGCRTELGCKATVFSSVEAADRNGHPCPKPLRAMRYFVALGSEPNDTILDPFMGSGTTLVAAKLLGRRAIGIEICEEYCQIAVERLKQGMLPFEAPTDDPEQQGDLLEALP